MLIKLAYYTYQLYTPHSLVFRTLALIYLLSEGVSWSASEAIYKYTARKEPIYWGVRGIFILKLVA